MKKPTKAQFEKFTDELLTMAWEACDLNGADIQSIAVDTGLIEEVTVFESCGDGCICAEYVFPATCFKKTY